MEHKILDMLYILIYFVLKFRKKEFSSALEIRIKKIYYKKSQYSEIVLKKIRRLSKLVKTR